MIRRFVLHRHDDPTGVSGTGTVAEGAQFTDGTAVLRWLSEWPTTATHQLGVDSITAIHGHAGSTRIVWLDPEDSP